MTNCLCLRQNMRRLALKRKLVPEATSRRWRTQGPGKVVYAAWSRVSVRWGVAGVVAVGGGDVGVAVQAQEADGQVALPSPGARSRL